ncbi:MAG TPA: phage tail tape measure protein [Chitinophagales bacterium]|nr:phage tail tape measure protein [Chitinophagales bacterium]
MSTAVTYNVNVATGNTDSTLNNVSKGVSAITQNVGGMKAAFDKIGAAAFTFNNIAQSIGSVTTAINQSIEPGVKLDSSLKDLQAITGATDSQLQLIKKSARESGLAFGVDAAGGVESYKLLLSQLSPELAKAPIALKGMGDDIAIFSKQLKGDTAGAAAILTTAMNQYGVSVEDPMKATKTMGVMMNIMSAAAKEGSAELPQIKSALEQAGLMAKTANVSFAETNSAIQVLDKAGKKGAEGGVAIRNLLAEMSLGAKQPKVVAAGMAALGVDLSKVADQSLTFAQRLDILKPALRDQGLLTQYVGKENLAATIALIQGTGEMNRYTKAIVGTNSATEMAGIVMDSYEEKMNRVWARMKDVGISAFDLMRPVLPAFQVFGAGITFVAQFGAAINAVSIISNTAFGAAIGRATTATWGFVRSLFASTVSLVRVGLQYAATAAMVLGGFVTSLISATAAQLGLNVAMSANPFGLIVIGVAAAVGIVIVLIKYWDTIKEKVVQFAHWFVGIADTIFPGFAKSIHVVFDGIKEKFAAFVGWVKDAISYVKDLFGAGDEKKEVNVISDIRSNKAHPVTANNIPGIDIPNAAQKNEAIVGKSQKEAKSTAENITSGGSKPTNIYVTIGKFQDKIEIHAATMKEGVDDIVRLIDERFLAVLNSANALTAK